MSIVCNHCRTINKDEASYCKECGTKLLKTTTNASSGAQQNTTSDEGGAKGLLLLVAIVVIGLILFSIKKSNDGLNATTEAAPAATEEVAPSAEKDIRW